MTSRVTDAAVPAGSATVTPAPEGGSRIRLVLILGLLTALGPFTVDMYLPALPAIADDLATSDATVQLTLTGTLLGLAVGQLVIGPLSDVLGRRRPLVVGTSVHVLASLACWFAPSITVLGALRTLQGLGAAATGVIAMAVVRDLYAGRDAAVVLSRLMLVMGVAPILAPTAGGLLLTVVSWHGIFLVLAGLGVAMMLLGGLAMPETLPPHTRVRGGIRPLLRTYGTVLRDRRFVMLALACGLGRAVLWAYIAGSAFVLQEQFHLSALTYGLAFTGGAAVLIASTQLNVVLLGHWSPMRISVVSLAVSALIGILFVGIAAAELGGVLGFVLPVLALLCATGFVMPNAPALALTRHGEAAGTASAIVGFAQFGGAAAVAPVVGVLGNTGLAVAVAMSGAALLALGALCAGARD
ncbi:multidrug effflux MFS transporter [Rhodococcus gannanensis]|uniref:Multidrug effflux MFS transporter n=1 Tax=Rhodococcus gannanensis TaxID=1960308 RepID=A0ABW4P9R1_9NOCA